MVLVRHSFVGRFDRLSSLGRGHGLLLRFHEEGRGNRFASSQRLVELAEEVSATEDTEDAEKR